MFGRIPWLSNLHICLTSELKSALNQPEEKNIGNCFSCVVSNNNNNNNNNTSIFKKKKKKKTVINI